MDPSTTPVPPHSLPSVSGAKINYLVRHWRGELPLGHSYWINGVLASLTIFVIAQLINGLGGGETLSLPGLAAAGIGFYLLSILLSTWQIVGIWRAASRHVERGGKPIWGALAKIAVAFGVINLIQVIGTNMTPQVIEFAKIISGDAEIPPYEIVTLPRADELEFRGGLRAGAAKALERSLNSNQQAHVLHINSPGGRLQEARAMTRLVQDRKLITYTSDQCLSAATLVFIAGQERVIGGRARLGFHRALLPGATRAQQLLTDKIVGELMRSAGISAEFIQKVLATPNESMWFPSADELRHAGVANSQAFGDRFAVSGSILKSSSPEAIDQVFSAMPGLRAARELEPITYQAMLCEISSAIQSGQSEGEAIARSRTMLQPLMVKYLPRASDDALRGMCDYWVRALEEFRGKDTRAAIALFSPKAVGTNYILGNRLRPELATNALVAIDLVLRSAAEHATTDLNRTKAERDLSIIRAKLSLKFPDDLDLLEKEHLWLKYSDRVCEMLLAFYSSVQQLPADREANVLRYLMSGSTPSPRRRPEYIF
jgi:hypothetical protein